MPNSQTNLSIRIDKDLKKEFDKLCKELGMTMTTAVCIFAKQSVRERCIPFEITAISNNTSATENE